MALVLCETDIINADIYLKFTKSFTIKENIVGYCDVTKVYFSNKLFVYREEASRNFWSSSMMCMTLMCVKTVPGYYRLKNPAARLQLEFTTGEESWSGFFCTQRFLLQPFPGKLVQEHAFCRQIFRVLGSVWYLHCLLPRPAIAIFNSSLGFFPTD